MAECMISIFFDKLPEPEKIDVVDPVAVRNRIAAEMQGPRGVITISVRGGRLVIVDTASVRMVV